MWVKMEGILKEFPIFFLGWGEKDILKNRNTFRLSSFPREEGLLQNQRNIH